MYAPAYGFGQGNLSAPFNPNGIPPPAQSNPHHHQQQPGLQHQQQQLQQPQHMMYNPQQYGGAVSHQSPYGASSPGMGGNAGAMGMMQNNGMAHMAGGHAVPTYQTPYSSSPYGGSIPASTASNLPPNFMPASNGQSFNMNATNMNLQHPAQRMQPPPTSSTPTQSGQRVSPFAGGQQITPPNAATAQSQFSPPQAPNQANVQSSNTNPPGQSGPVLTPQTPTFPQGSQGVNALSTPLSPGSEAREKERVTLLLEINSSLLLEVMRMNAQHAQAEAKKDEAAAAASPDGSEKDKAEKEKTTKPPASREYFECMRRLQSNLAYLAAIADRSHKPSSQIPAHPAIMSAPWFPPKSSQPSSATNTSPTADSKKEETDDKKPIDFASEEDRSETLKEQYKKLQSLFPGVDPKKEPTANQAARAQAQAAAMQAQKQAGAGGAVDMNAQQKMQNDLLRQKMMQAREQQMAQQQQQNR